MSRIYVKPAEGRTVLLPGPPGVRRRGVAAGGQWIELDTFVSRRLRDGDLVRVPDDHAPKELDDSPADAPDPQTVAGKAAAEAEAKKRPAAQPAPQVAPIKSGE